MDDASMVTRTRAARNGEKVGESMESALQIVRLQERVTAVVEKMNHTASNINDTLGNVRADLRSLSERFEEVTRLQQDQIAQSQGMQRAFDSIERLHKEVSEVTKRVYVGTGIALAISISSGILVNTWLDGLNSRFSSSDKSVERLEQQLDKREGELKARVAALEIANREDKIFGK